MATRSILEWETWFDRNGVTVAEAQILAGISKWKLPANDVIGYVGWFFKTWPSGFRQADVEYGNAIDALQERRLIQVIDEHSLNVIRTILSSPNVIRKKPEFGLSCGCLEFTPQGGDLWWKIWRTKLDAEGTSFGWSETSTHCLRDVSTPTRIEETAYSTSKLGASRLLLRALRRHCVDVE